MTGGMDNKTTVDRVIEKLGGRPAATRAIGISPQAMQKWVKSGRVPVERVVAVSKLTGIPPAELRPDVAAHFGVVPEDAA